MLEILAGAGLFAADRRIKDSVEATRDRGDESDIAGGHMKLCLHHNYGSAANLGAGSPAIVKLVSIVLTAVVSIFFIIALSTGGNRRLKTGLGLLLGGAFSNTYDRIKKGYVIDYVRFNHGPEWFRKLIWNISDFGIIIGTLLALIS